MLSDMFSHPSSRQAPSRAASGQYVDVPMHGKILNVRVDGSLGDGGRQPAAGDGVAADVTTRSRYVIVGYGVAGSAALKAVLEVEPEAEVLVIENDQASKARKAGQAARGSASRPSF